MDIESLQGQVFGKIELHELLGTGGMSAVYRGYDPNLGREVAIKVLSPGLRNQPDYLSRFQREARTMASLTHSHIVTVHSFDNAGEIFYIVMSLLKGGTLEQRRKNQPLSLKNISQILNELCKALDYAHAKGIVHRDIKTNNVLFDEQGNSFISDFGIAKLLNPVTKLTSDGQMVGTIDYMAPEQWEGSDVSPATDIYALGILSYLLLLGKLPFVASNPVQIMYKHVQEPARFPKDFPKTLVTCLQKALAKRPEDRYTKAMDFAEAFQAAIVDLPPLKSYSFEHGEEEVSRLSQISQLSEVSRLTRRLEQPTEPRNKTSVDTLKSIYSTLAVFFAAVSLFLSIPILQSVFASPTNTQTPTPSPTMTITPSETANPSQTPSPTITDSPSPSPSVTNTMSPTASPSHTPRATIRPTVMNTAPPSPIPLVFPITGTLSAEQNIYNHDFYVTGRSIISINAEATAFDPNISLLNDSNEIIGFNDDCPGEGTASCITRFPLDEAGWYEIAVHSFDGRGYGEFTLTINSIEVCSQTEPIAIVTGEMLNVREGPGMAYGLIGIVHEGDCLILKGRNSESSWYFVRFDESREGWLRADSSMELFWTDELPIEATP